MKKNVVIGLLLLSNVIFGYLWWLEVSDPRPRVTMHKANNETVNRYGEPVTPLYHYNWEKEFEYDENATLEELDFYATYGNDPNLRERLQEMGFGIEGFTRFKHYTSK